MISHCIDCSYTDHVSRARGVEVPILGVEPMIVVEPILEVEPMIVVEPILVVEPMLFCWFSTFW